MAASKQASNSKKKDKAALRKLLPLEQKLKIIVANEKGITTSKIAREYGINESSVRSILRKREFYKTLAASSTYYLKSLARHKNLLLEKVEQQLIAWIEDNNRKRIPLLETEVQRKALAIFHELSKGEERKVKFVASQGWFHRFKNRINMQNCIISSEEAPPDTAASERFRTDFMNIIQHGGYNLHQIFNVEEMNLYWKKLSHSETEKSKDCKPFKDSMTLLLGGNAAGDFKLKPMIVYRYETPLGLKNCEKTSLPVIWRSNKKGWLTEELFQEWFRDYFTPAVETYCSEKGLEYKIILLLDLTPSHYINDHNKNINIVYLPPNTSSILQPLSLGVFPLFRVNYVKQILTQALFSKEQFHNFWSSYNMKNAIDNIHTCWCDLNPEDLAGSWYQLLPDVKVQDFESQVAAVVQEVIALKQELGYQIDDLPEEVIQTPKIEEETIQTPKTEEVLCKVEAIEVCQEEDNQDPSLKEMAKIIQSVNKTCKLIAAFDLNVERSIGIQQVLQKGIQPYIDLYNERVTNSTDL